jgi:hypothetical protein
MARKATAKKSGGPAKAKKSPAKRPGASRAKGSKSRAGRSSGTSTGEAFISLLQSPLVAELVAVAATAALATLAEQGFTSRSDAGGRGKRAGKAVKEAGKAAANAVGRRLSIEIDEIKKAAKASKGGAKA